MCERSGPGGLQVWVCVHVCCWLSLKMLSKTLSIEQPLGRSPAFGPEKTSGLEKSRSPSSIVKSDAERLYAIKRRSIPEMREGTSLIRSLTLLRITNFENALSGHQAQKERDSTSTAQRKAWKSKIKKKIGIVLGNLRLRCEERRQMATSITKFTQVKKRKKAILYSDQKQGRRIESRKGTGVPNNRGFCSRHI